MCRRTGSVMLQVLLLSGRKRGRAQKADTHLVTTTPMWWWWTWPQWHYCSPVLWWHCCCRWYWWWRRWSARRPRHHHCWSPPPPWWWRSSPPPWAPPYTNTVYTVMQTYSTWQTNTTSHLHWCLCVYVTVFFLNQWFCKVPGHLAKWTVTSFNYCTK